jgi:exosortase A
MTHSQRLAGATALLVVAFLILYRTVIFWLVDDWDIDGNYSHGYLVLPIALYLVWERRRELRALTPSPDRWGLAALLASMALLAIGTVAAETSLARLSLVGSIAASIWFILGRRFVRVLAFPLVFLLFMVPIPDLIFNQIAFPLQLVASEFGEHTLSAIGIPVVREGNLIVLAHMSLDVAEACSGIRSLITLFTIAVLYGYFAVKAPAVRILLVLATVPIAIVANGLRVAATGVAAQFYGTEAAEGFFHSVSGWLVFVAAGIALLALKELFEAVARRATPFTTTPRGDFA